MTPSYYAYSELVDKIIYNSDCTRNFTRKDYIDLAMAAIDQAGFLFHDQNRIEALINEIKAKYQENDNKFVNQFVERAKVLFTEITTSKKTNQDKMDELAALMGLDDKENAKDCEDVDKLYDVVLNDADEVTFLKLVTARAHERYFSNEKRS